MVRPLVEDCRAPGQITPARGPPVVWMVQKTVKDVNVGVGRLGSIGGMPVFGQETRHIDAALRGRSDDHDIEVPSVPSVRRSARSPELIRSMVREAEPW
jgi:hypothetical protein